MINNQKEFENEKDMLRGNINRLYISNDLNELLMMVHFAKKRIDDLHDFRIKMILNKEDE